MPTKLKRFMVTVTEDIELDAAELKRTKYYDKPFSALYRDIMRAGLDSMLAQKKENPRPSERAG